MRKDRQEVCSEMLVNQYRMMWIQTKAFRMSVRERRKAPQQNETR